MFTTRETADSAAAPEEVFKLVYDPARAQEWLAATTGVEDIGPSEPADGGDEERRFTLYRQFAPGTPMVQVMRSFADQAAVSVDCTFTGIRFELRLNERPSGGTRIDCRVEAPDTQQELIPHIPAMARASVDALARLAEREA